MTDADRDRIAKEAEKYVKLQGTHDRPDITKHDYIQGATRENERMAELLKENKEADHKIFNEHRLEIEKIVMGCRGVKSREVHWSEAIPMLAAYVVRNTDKQLLKEERIKTIDECLDKFDKQWKEQAIAFTAHTHYIAYVDLLKQLESLKGKSQ